MANLPESSTYETGIYQLETTDPVQGGLTGISNQQGKQLANRTRWLKDRSDTQAGQITELQGRGLIVGGAVYLSASTTLTSTAWGKFHNVITGASPRTITLPAIAGGTADVGKTITIKHDNDGGNTSTLTVVTQSSQNISFESFISGSMNLQPGDVVILMASRDAALVNRWEVISLFRNAEKVPTGSIQAMATATVPLGYLKANGQTVSRTTFARLFAVIGTTFNTGGESASDFRLPDLRGEFIRGWDDARGVDSGRVLGSAQADELKAHTHTEQNTSGSLAVAAGGSGTCLTTQNTTNTGSTGGAETRPRNVALMYVIKF
jgi:phage-related tail fiber protein